MNDPDLAKALTYSNYRGETVVLSPDLFLEALAELDRIGDRLSQSGGTLSPEEALSHVRTIYRVVDRIGTSVEEGMACKAGCASCCRMMVAVTRGEGEILRERVAREPAGPRKTLWEEGLAARTETLLSLADAEESPLSTLDALLATCVAYEKEFVFCPFLGPDRLCGIYEDRPLMCRICWTLTDPKDCDPGEGPPVKFRNEVFFRAFDLVHRIGAAGFGDGRHRPIPLWLTQE